MEFGYALFFAAMAAYLGLLVVGYWSGKLGSGLSGKGLLITALLAFVSVLLFLLFGPEILYTPAAVIGVVIVAITLISFWITG